MGKPIKKEEQPPQHRRKKASCLYPTYDVQSVSVMREYDDVIMLRMRTRTGDAMDFMLEPAAALAFLGAFSNAVAGSAVEWARSIFIGDCETCKNVRLTDQKGPGGRMVKVHCPDCSDRFSEAMGDGFPPRPRIGGGMK